MDFITPDDCILAVVYLTQFKCCPHFDNVERTYLTCYWVGLKLLAATIAVFCRTMLFKI